LLETKKRQVLVYGRKTVYRAYNPLTGVGSTSTYACNFVFSERLKSEGHLWPPHRKSSRDQKFSRFWSEASKTKKRKYAKKYSSLLDLSRGPNPKRVILKEKLHVKIVRGWIHTTRLKISGRRARRMIQRYYDRMLKRYNDPRKAKRALRLYKRAVRFDSPGKRRRALRFALRRYWDSVRFIIGVGPKPGSDLGGDFCVQKVIPPEEGKYFHLVYNLNQYQRQEFDGHQYAYDWRFLPLGDESSYLSPSTSIQLDAAGTNFIKRAIPLNPLANLGQFFGELRKDGIPSIPLIELWRDKAAYFRDLQRRAGSEYLNYAFGWRPFINDIIEFAKVVPYANKHLHELNTNSGKLVRRRRSNPTIVEVTTEDLGSSYGAIAAAGCFPTAGRLSRVRTTKTDRWFSGAFTYYLPDSNTTIGKARLYEAYANKLFGLRIDPLLLWKLAPWSWAVDWWFNIGDIIHNWSAFTTNDLVMQYGYVMEKIHRESTYTLTGLGDCYGQKHTLSQTWQYITKSRRRATPFGFGLNPSSFTTAQWAIIAALGISKAPRSLVY